jgi:ubiquinone/menaquinone biosynthesis C-methylase UbiE
VSDPTSKTDRAAQLSKNYSSEAVVYERLWAPGLRDAGGRLLDRLELSSITAILDLGTGTGALLDDISSRSPHAVVVGADRSHGMVTRARPHHGRLVLDAMGLGCRSDSFDAVTMCFVLFHLPEPTAGLREVHRVLKPGGTVGTLTWGPNESWPARAIIDEILDDYGADPSEPLLSQHHLVDSGDKVAGLMEAAGFVAIETWLDLLEREWTPELVLDFVTGMASPKRRFDSLPPAVHDGFLATARARLEKLDREAFLEVSEFVGATGRKPG